MPVFCGLRDGPAAPRLSALRSKTRQRPPTNYCAGQDELERSLNPPPSRLTSNAGTWPDSATRSAASGSMTMNIVASASASMQVGASALADNVA
jgi:hypothetical protein